MYFSFLVWASTSAAIQRGLSSSNVLCFIAIVAIVSFEQINQSINQSVTCMLTACTPGSAPGPTIGNEYEKLFYLSNFTLV